MVVVDVLVHSAPNLLANKSKGGFVLMYGKVLGVATATTATTAAVTLPNTGGNVVVSIAVSVAAGLVAWGVLYARSTN
jgi:hypothetical protein